MDLEEDKRCCFDDNSSCNHKKIAKPAIIKQKSRSKIGTAQLLS